MLSDKSCTTPQMSYPGVSGGSVCIPCKNSKTTRGVQVGPLKKNQKRLKRKGVKGAIGIDSLPNTKKCFAFYHLCQRGTHHILTEDNVSPSILPFRDYYSSDMTIINVDFVSITNRYVSCLAKLASAEEGIFCKCRYNTYSASGLTDGVMEFGDGCARGEMAVGKCKNFCRALVCWDERITNFTGI